MSVTQCLLICQSDHACISRICQRTLRPTVRSSSNIVYMADCPPDKMSRTLATDSPLQCRRHIFACSFRISREPREIEICKRRTSRALLISNLRNDIKKTQRNIDVKAWAHFSGSVRPVKFCRWPGPAARPGIAVAWPVSMLEDRDRI